MNRMSLAAKTTTENGAPAKSVADLAVDPGATSPLEGLLVSMNTSAVGSRGSGKKSKTGLPRPELEAFVADYLRTVAAQATTKPEEAANFLAFFFVHLAYSRDIRDGKGERDLAYWTIMEVWLYYPETLKALLPMLTWETYGSFKDLNRLLELCATSPHSSHRDLSAFVEGMWVDALRRDAARLASTETESKTSEANTKLSLAGKWAPRQDSHTDKVCPGLVFRLAWALAHPSDDGPLPSFDPSLGEHKATMKAYRVLCSTLNRHLATPEVAMCGRAWDTIDPTRVPGRCHKMRREALLNRCKGGTVRSTQEDRVACAAKFTALYEEVKNNPKAAAAKGLLKTKTLTPFDIVSHFVSSHSSPDPTLEAQWAVFVEAQRGRFTAGGGLVGGIPIGDVSGSMSGAPLQACVAFCLLLANLLPEPWRGQMMTFSSNPAWHRIPLEKSLQEQVQSIKSAHWQMSTDFSKAMDLILTTAIENRVPADQMPKVLYVFTDMQFDAAQGSSYVAPGYGGRYASEAPTKWETVHETVEARFAKAGYEMPFIVYWNLRGNTGKPNYQVSSSTPNTAMLSGFSSSAFDAFCSGNPTSFREATPLERLETLLKRDCYDRVREVCSLSSEGPLASYVWTPPPIDVVVDGGMVDDAMVDEPSDSKEPEDSASKM